VKMTDQLTGKVGEEKTEGEEKERKDEEQEVRKSKREGAS